MNILFITANRVGDAVLTTGLLKWLVDTYPEARFTIACGPYGADLFRAVPRLKRLIVMVKKRANGHWLNLWCSCIGTRWDLIVDLRNSLASRLLISRACVTHKRSTGAHKVVDNGSLLGLSPPPSPYIWLTAEAKHAAELLVKAQGNILALGPAANWGAKQWPIEQFIALVKDLTAEGAPMANAAVMILSDRHEREQIQSLLDSISAERRIEVIGQDLQTAAACLKKARLYIGNDSGLMHLSAALGTPTLGLFGPGFPAIYGPWGKQCAYVTTPESRDELMTRLPPGLTPVPSLMTTLTVTAVVAAARDLLERN